MHVIVWYLPNTRSVFYYTGRVPNAWAGVLMYDLAKRMSLEEAQKTLEDLSAEVREQCAIEAA